MKKLFPLQYPGGPCTLHHLDLYRLLGNKLLPARDLAFLGAKQHPPLAMP